MPERGRDPPWGNITQLRRMIKHETEEEFYKYMKSSFFEPIFDQYLNSYVRPAQNSARSAGSTSRPRGPNIMTVQQCMISGDRNGIKRWNYPSSEEIERFSHVEWLAYTIHMLLHRNKSVGGIFNGTGLESDDCFRLCWRLVKYAEFSYSPTRLANQAKSKRKRAPATDEQRGSVDEDGFEEEAEPEPMDVPQGSIITNERILLPAASKYSNQPVEIEFINDPADVAHGHRSEESENDPDHPRLSDNAVKIMEECNSLTPNLEYRFWKAILISIATQHSAHPDLAVERINFSASFADVADAEAITWMKQAAGEHVDSQRIKSQPFDEDAKDRFDKMQTLLDNKDYQVEDIEHVCKFFGLSVRRDGLYRLPGMAVGRELKFYQLPAVYYILSCYYESPLGGCVLADGVGLGKTWTAIAVLLMLSKKQTENDYYGKRKPFLILTPPSVCQQWIQEIVKMTANYFQIYRYVGDSRRLAHEHNVQPLKGVLTKTHPIFSEHNVERTLIVSTYQTFRQRHSVAIHERTSRDQFGKPSAQREATDSGDWAGNLEGKFQTVIMDEAHEIKDERADVSATIRSLQTPFHIMLTATPIPNGIDDWKGYVEFIKPSDMSDDSMDPEQVRKMKLPKHIKPRDFNPFHEDLVSREHPAAWIRFTMRAAQEHIFSTSVSDEIKGINLHSIWKSCLMRRTNSSMIPFNTGRKISDDIPRVHAVNIQCKLGARDGEKTVYEQAREELQAGLVNKKGKKLSWSLRHQRKLILLSTATYLPKLDENFDLRANNIRKILDKDHFWVEWLQYLFPATPLAQYRRDAFRQLTLLLNGAPKIRAFLNIIKTQIVRDNKKVLVFVQLPASGLLLYAILKILQISASFINAGTKNRERDQILFDFNNDQDGDRVLLVTSGVGGTGINCQKQCCHVHILETPLHESLRNQMIGRVRRIACCSDVVRVYEYHVAGAFDNRQVTKAIHKALPEAIAQLNSDLLQFDRATESIDIGEWVIYNGQLRRVEDVRPVALKRLSILSPIQFLRQLLLEARGEIVTVD